MAQFFKFPPQPKVFTPAMVTKLHELSEVTRLLRSIGCRILHQSISVHDEKTEVVVDRNPHLRINGCSSVHVTFGGFK